MIVVTEQHNGSRVDTDYTLHNVGFFRIKCSLFVQQQLPQRKTLAQPWIITSYSWWSWFSLQSLSIPPSAGNFCDWDESPSIQANMADLRWREWHRFGTWLCRICHAPAADSGWQSLDTSQKNTLRCDLNDSSNRYLAFFCRLLQHLPSSTCTRGCWQICSHSNRGGS